MTATVPKSLLFINRKTFQHMTSPSAVKPAENGEKSNESKCLSVSVCLSVTTWAIAFAYVISLFFLFGFYLEFLHF